VELESEPYPKRRVDAMSAVMILVTVAGLAGTAWLWFGRPSATPVGVGREAPPLRLIDLKTSEPIVLAGLNDKVVWLVFWSAAGTSGRSCLAKLDAAARLLQTHRRFAMVVAAVDSDDPSAVRKAIDESGVKQTVYLAGPETRQRFGAENADPPLHVLIDAGGQIRAMARGDSRATVRRFADQVLQRLDELDPIDEARFAWSAAKIPTSVYGKTARE
jgi:peroxiredoxin